MNKKLLEILVCPFDKVTQLDLIEFKTNSGASQETNTSPNKKDASNSNISESKKNQNITHTQDIENQRTVTAEKTNIVEEGLLLCKACLRFYPIIEEIPIILPDDLRNKKKDIEFLKKWKELIPKDLINNLKPWTV
ncbi:Trm112 family protein [Candidatus Nitrosocosmicus agrestis]|uniref:Trm112 family protein n=1 Tax=Candidatus Nitrosocosmicus agrestis TaxID=2563600 RepID=UPI00133189B5|nr:Trm112 family protein [Candidatus Nitrosocosmicus sp. SS]